jgi:peptidoglycan/xylan/chitin deacetylase (PgdA/CDA1 family)
MTLRMGAVLIAVVLLGAVAGFAWVATSGPGGPGQGISASVPRSAAPTASGADVLHSPAASADPSSADPSSADPSPSSAGSSQGSIPPSPGPTAAPAATPTPYAGPLTRQVPVLMYHRIADPAPGVPYPGLYVSPSSFDAQMHALHDAGWRTITAGQLGAAMGANQPVPVRTFVVMFDDGYEDNFTSALPILRRYGYVATFSVVAAGGGSMMTSPQLAALLAAGMEVGNHTLSHKNVANISGPVLTQQIDGGEARIEARLATQGVTYVPRTFVYPSGHVGPAALALLRKDGYTDAFTEVPGVALIGTTPPLQIPRIRVSRFEDLGAFLGSMPAEPKP